MTPLGLAFSAWVALKVVPGSQGSGIPQAIAARHVQDPAAKRRLLSPRIAVGKILLTLVGLACGASIGREGPTVQVGASIMLMAGSIAGLGREPGLILADIQLADGSSGLDAVNDLLKAFEVPVIFITAYPERFLTGERPEPAFLIAKPFQPANVSAVISQALFFQQSARRRETRATALPASYHVTTRRSAPRGSGEASRNR